jgi:RNA polymerase sigma factor (sigma-70 family)
MPSIEDYLPLAASAARIFLRRRPWLLHDLDEVFAEARLILVQRAAAYEPARSSPETYFLTAVLRGLIDWQRREKRHSHGRSRGAGGNRRRPMPGDLAAPPAADALESSDAVAAVAAVAGARDAHLVRAIAADLSAGEVAAQLGIKARTVYVYKCRLLPRLATRDVLSLLGG